MWVNKIQITFIYKGRLGHHHTSVVVEMSVIESMIPVVQAAVQAKFGIHPVVVYNIDDYCHRLNYHIFPDHKYYMHVRDAANKTCTDERIRYTGPADSMKVCTVNGRSVECNVAVAKVKGQVVKFSLESGEKFCVQLDTGMFTCKGQEPKPFSSVDELTALVLACIVPGKLGGRTE